MQPLSILLLAIAAFVTATISGIIGMGGGILLLATLFCFLEHGQAVPIHATVQIASNGTRVLAFLRYVDWPTLGRFAIGALPGGLIGALLLWLIGPLDDAEPYLKISIGAYILVVTFLPKPKGEPRPGHRLEFTLLGLAAGTAAIIVGAAGPLIAPLFARRAFVRERLVATKATCQMLLHVAKIPAFILLGTIDFAEFSVLILAMIAVVIPGTLLGKRLLRHVSAEQFVVMYKIALTVAGLKVLLIDGLYALMWAG